MLVNFFALNSSNILKIVAVGKNSANELNWFGHNHNVSLIATFLHFLRRPSWIFQIDVFNYSLFVPYRLMQLLGRWKK